MLSGCVQNFCYPVVSRTFRRICKSKYSKWIFIYIKMTSPLPCDPVTCSTYCLLLPPLPGLFFFHLINLLAPISSKMLLPSIVLDIGAEYAMYYCNSVSWEGQADWDRSCGCIINAFLAIRTITAYNGIYCLDICTSYHTDTPRMWISA